MSRAAACMEGHVWHIQTFGMILIIVYLCAYIQAVYVGPVRGGLCVPHI